MLVAGYDTRPSDNVRVEVAFSTAPDSATPAYVDLSPRVSLRAGIDITRGRTDEFTQAQPGRCTLTFDNTDGALTPDNSSSPYYPNVLPQRRIHVSYRNPGTLGQYNLLAAEDASFEGGTTGSWQNYYFGAPAASTLVNSTAHPYDGSKGMQIQWPTAAAGAGAQIGLSSLVTGRQYTARAIIWNTPGSPAVEFGASPTVSSTTTGAFEALTFTWTATSSTLFLRFATKSASTSGQSVYVDSIMLDEGSSLGPFTTVAPPILDLFTGYVDEWPLEWPTGDDTYAWSVVTASDMFSRLGRREGLRSVIAETVALDSPQLYYPLGEPSGSTVFSNVAPTTQPALVTIQRGTGGTFAAAAGTGAPTDGLPAPTFTAANATNGIYLSAKLSTGIGFFGGTMRASINTTVNTREQVAVCLADLYGSRFEIGTDATGHAMARVWNAFAGANSPSLSGPTVADGLTHDIAFTASVSGSTITWTLYVDGVSAASTTSNGTAINYLGPLYVGGGPASAMFSGTICHVSAQSTALSAARLLDYRTALTTGFSGERSDQRITRIATWCGLPASALSLDVGNSTSVAHIDCTGVGPLDYMRQVETTEAGVLFVNAQGQLVLRNRARSYTQSSPSITIPAALLDPPPRPVKNLLGVLNDVTGSRPLGTSVRVVNQDSVGTYGVAKGQETYLLNSDSDLTDAVNWRVAAAATPRRRIPELAIDAMTDPSSGPFRALDIGNHIQVTGMPSQMGSTTLDQMVQGQHLIINDSAWTITANTTNYADLLAFVVEHPVYGTADGPGVAIY